MSNLHNLFLECMKLPEERWPEVLESRCGNDSSLRKEVEELLNADRLNRQAGFLEVDASPQRNVWGRKIGPGECIGGYVLQELLGTGGFGIVYKARALESTTAASEFSAFSPLATAISKSPSTEISAAEKCGSIALDCQDLGNKTPEPNIPDYKTPELNGRESEFITSGQDVSTDASSKFASQAVTQELRNPRNPWVAIKLLQPWLNDTSGYARFQAEVSALRSLNHANIAKWIDAGIDGGIPFLVMEFIDGQPLDETLRDETGKLDRNRFQLNQRIEWIADVCRGVSAAHGQLMLHRDLKPGNVIINAANRAVITDFGLAKYVGPELSNQPPLTSYGRALGTMQFMAPEQFVPGAQLGLATDLYGIGGLLYFVLTGKPPHELPKVSLHGALIRSSQPTSMRAFDSSIPKDLETICLKCLHPQSSQRYPTAEAVLEDLEHYLQGLPISARPIGFWERAWYWCRRRPKVAGLLAILGLGLLFSTVAIVGLWWQANENLAMAVQRNDDLLEMIDNLSDMVRDAESDPATVRLQQRMLNTIADGYEQITQATAEPTDNETLFDIGVVWFKLGRKEKFLGNLEKSKQAYLRAEQAFRELTRREPDNLHYRFQLFHALTSQRKQAESLHLIESIVTADQTGDPFYLDAYSETLRYQATLEFSDRDWKSAFGLLDKAEGISAELAKKYPLNSLHTKKLGQINSLLMQMNVHLERLNAGYDCLLESVRFFENANELSPNDDGIGLEFNWSLLRAAGWKLAQSDPETAQVYLDRADTASQQLLVIFPDYVEAWKVRMLYLQLAMLKNYYHHSEAEFQASRQDYEAFLRRWLDSDPACRIASTELARLISDPSFTAEPDVETAWQNLQSIDLYLAGEVSILESAALVAFRRGDFQRALSQFEQLLESIYDVTDRSKFADDLYRFRNYCRHRLELAAEPPKPQLDDYSAECQRVRCAIVFRFMAALHTSQSFANEVEFVNGVEITK